MKKRVVQSGFTMIEILIVTAIIGLLVIIAISTLPQQINKSRDARRKSDLQKIKVAFENYYSDNDCYPDANVLDNCNSEDLSPYLASIPCDPKTKTKYLYAPEYSSCPHYYRVFSNLEVETDPVIEALGCNSDSGCGAYNFFSLELGLDAFNYDYGVSEGVPILATSKGIPLGTTGSCCAFIGDSCNGYTQGEEGVCVQFFLNADDCEAVCNP